jgi:hypothetical protein
MSSDWYARRLGVTTPPARGISVGPQAVPSTPAPQPYPSTPPPAATTVQEPPPPNLSAFLSSNSSKGGDARRTDGDRRCPNCGSGNLFSQAGQAIMKNDGTMVSPSPKCFECGWNGRFAQADQSTWATS